MARRRLESIGYNHCEEYVKQEFSLVKHGHLESTHNFRSRLERSELLRARRHNRKEEAETVVNFEMLQSCKAIRLEPMI